MKLRTLVTCLLMAAAVALVAVDAAAQVFTGRVEVTVTDSTGAVLPGVAVEVTGPQNRSAVTDANGAAVFLGLPPHLRGPGSAGGVRRLPQSERSGQRGRQRAAAGGPRRERSDAAD